MKYSAEISKIIQANKTHNHWLCFEDGSENTNNGPLSGTTFGIKDNIWLKGKPCTGGSKSLENFIPTENATVVEKLIAAGATVIGKTNLDEFGLGGTGLFSGFGEVKNAHDVNRLAGGSSSGSAVALGLGEVTFAIGTDTGDSIRKPASINGVVGVKPTYGIISRYGVIPYDGSFDTIGFFTANIKDAAKLVEITQGSDLKDLTSTTKNLQTYTDKMTGNLTGKRICYIKEVYDQFPDEYKHQFNVLVSKMKEAGAIVEPVIFGEQLLDVVLPTYRAITFVNALSGLNCIDGINFGKRAEGEAHEEIVFNSRNAGFAKNVRKRLVAGAWASDGENLIEIFEKAKKVRSVINNRYYEVMEGFDAMINIASLIAPTIIDFENGQNHENKFDDYLQIANHTGAPSVVQKLGEVDGMPFGIDVMTRPYEDLQMFDIALGIENILGGGK